MWPAGPRLPHPVHWPCQQGAEVWLALCHQHNLSAFGDALPLGLGKQGCLASCNRADRIARAIFHGISTYHVTILHQTLAGFALNNKDYCLSIGQQSVKLTSRIALNVFLVVS